MSAVVGIPAVPADPDDVTILYNVSWKTYESLLEDYEDRRIPRFTFDQGRLEIMSPTPRHEKRGASIASLIDVLVDEWGMTAEGFGSTTFRRADIETGFEPDECFYIQNADAMFDRDEIDLSAGDPPPDLIVEIEVSSPSLPKFPLYARIGVSEIWRGAKNGDVIIYILREGQYQLAEASLSLPRLSLASLNMLLSWYKGSFKTPWLRRVRAWAREQA